MSIFVSYLLIRATLTFGSIFERNLGKGLGLLFIPVTKFKFSFTAILKLQLKVFKGIFM